MAIGHCRDGINAVDVLHLTVFEPCRRLEVPEGRSLRHFRQNINTFGLFKMPQMQHIRLVAIPVVHRVFIFGFIY